ncbi:MAG: exopolyphosphatase [Flavobacteriales bacterium]|jgi:exopolyphosphatase/guanosine-5'-triphosphate,3'-diphosphate pyrophosphatase|nr:exopolyphosphatase [Flavobacteriales bacterium]
MVSKKLASIDIGSNAIRLLIMTANETKNGTVFKKNSLIRVPIRLGQDVFTDGKISERNYQRFIEAMQGFQHIMKAHEVAVYRACATSAMRNSANANKLLKETKAKTTLDIDIINGEEEAKIIYQTHIENMLDENASFLYIDVGGGSTEITIFDGKRAKASRSFKIGTIRLLNNLVEEKKWTDFENWIKENTQDISNLKAIASGGNINRVFKILGKKKWTPIQLSEMLRIKEEISSVNFEERQIQFNMNPDRADVILPALEIYSKAFEVSRIKEIFVPKIGLADGIIRNLYLQEKKVKFLL